MDKWIYDRTVVLGYKIYFNGEKFVADNTTTEVQKNREIYVTPKR